MHAVQLAYALAPVRVGDEVAESQTPGFLQPGDPQLVVVE